MDRSTSLGHRYAPLLVLIAVQVLLVAVVPSRGARTGLDALDAGSGGGGNDEAVFSEGTTDPGATDIAGVGAQTGGGGSGTGAKAGTGAATGVGGLGQSGLARGFDHRDQGEWPWTHPWKLTGDRSKCAPGGQLQDNVLTFAPPCAPRFNGDNGGATAKGVTKEEIVGVYYLPKPNPALQAILRSGDLDASREEYDLAVQANAKFFTKHYEFYGRRLKMVTHEGECDGTDITCMRNDAKTLVAKYQPFFVIFTSPQPPEFYDELSRAGVVNYGGWMFGDSFNNAHRPYHWDLFMSGTVTARNGADYWCKKMAGKNATLAGDPLLRSRKRRLGIVVPQDDVHVQASGDMVAAVTGGMCGTPTDKPVVVSYSATDPARAQEESTNMAVSLKQAGVTTVAWLTDLFIPVYLTRAMDQQQYFPEHLLTLQEGADHDYLGRLYSPTQWRNAFGPSLRPMEIPLEQQDNHKAWHDVGTPGEPRYVTTVTMMYMKTVAMALQWAGPNLNPLTFERGNFEAPQIGGYDRSDVWPGHKCCIQWVQLWEYGPNDYTAVQDSKQVYYDPNAPSRIDGRPGAYVCLEDCKRYRVGQWPRGEPRQ